jgi:hypothetical protein
MLVSPVLQVAVQAVSYGWKAVQKDAIGLRWDNKRLPYEVFAYVGTLVSSLVSEF